MTNFRPFPPRETYAKLILLKKCNFYHKIIFFQRLETTLPIGLFGCNFVNLGNFISISTKSWYFSSSILKINPFLHVYCTKFIKNIYFFTNFEFSQKFSVKSQNFLHIEIVPIMYEWGKVEKVPENKILYTSILKQCDTYPI